MDKLKLLFVLLLSVVMPIKAQSTTGGSTQKAKLEFKQIGNNSPTLHRSPINLDLEVYYDVDNSTIYVVYEGDAYGIVNLYLNDVVIGYSPEINAVFSVSTPGLYKIEIIGESWTAEGYLQL
ncbi:MAG: hypothetical protein KIG61_08285 [Muribaculaceae bacterium]|nr:hypothetical protein [Muribaculaceae bacterium]